MNLVKRIGLSLAMCSLFSGCASHADRSVERSQQLNASCPSAPVQQKIAPPVTIECPDPVALSWLQYIAQLSRMDPASLRDEHVRLTSELSVLPTTAGRLRLALLLSMPGSALQDDSRAEELFKDVISDDAMDADSRTLANMLLTRSVQKVRIDAKRKEALTHLKSEQDARAVVEKKLQALTSIEKSMSDRLRPEATPAAPTAPQVEKPPAPAGAAPAAKEEPHD